MLDMNRVIRFPSLPVIQVNSLNIMRSSSKDFKKKPKPPSLLPEKATSSKKLVDLKAKMETQRQIARTTTGKRFRETQNLKTNEISIQTSVEPVKQKLSITKINKPSVTSSRSSISLSEISLKSSNVDLSESQNFEQFGWKQEENNKEIREFLKKIRMEKYADELIYAGFDDLETLLEIDREVLNSLRIKASHQKVLEDEITKIKLKRGHGIAVSTQDIDRSIISSYSSISSRNRPKTQYSMQSDASFLNRTQIVQPKMKKRSPDRNPSPLKSSGSFSFIYNAGGRNFNLVSKEPNNLERKACCTCFKVTYTPLRYGNYYYCSENCIEKEKERHKRPTNTSKPKVDSSFKKQSPAKAGREISKQKQRKQSKQSHEEEDILAELSSISLSSSFIREYK